MSDLLSQGGDREPSPWPRRVLVLAVVAAIITAVIVTHLPHGRRSPARSARATAAASPSSLAVPGPATTPQPLPTEADGIIGPALPWAAGRLPVAGPRPSWFWPDTGRLQVIGRLPRDAAGYLFTRIGGGWVIQASAPGRPACGTCAGSPLPVYYLADHAQSVARLGVADDVAPGAAAGTLWLTSYPPGAALATASGTAQEVSVAGAAPRPLVRLPTGQVIARATDRGLLLAPAVGEPGVTTDRLWDPARSAPGRTFAAVIAASATQIAWAAGCTPQCQMRVIYLPTGRTTVVRLPSGSSAANAAFSPDGSLLALQLTLSSGGDGGAPAMLLEVASVASGRLSVVPDTFVSSDALVGFGWASGGSLVAELSFTTKVQLAAWRPGASRLAVVVVRPHGQPLTLVVG